MIGLGVKMIGLHFKNDWTPLQNDWIFPSKMIGLFFILFGLYLRPLLPNDHGWKFTRRLSEVVLEGQGSRMWE